MQVHAICIAFQINSLAFYQIVFTVLSSPLVVRTMFLRQLLWLSHLVILEKTPLGRVLAEPGDPQAHNFCSWATRKSYFLHTNHMPGTLDFTVPEQWASFNFPQSTALAAFYNYFKKSLKCPDQHRGPKTIGLFCSHLIFNLIFNQGRSDRRDDAKRCEQKKKTVIHPLFLCFVLLFCFCNLFFQVCMYCAYLFPGVPG